MNLSLALFCNRDEEKNNKNSSQKLLNFFLFNPYSMSVSLLINSLLKNYKLKDIKK